MLISIESFDMVSALYTVNIFGNLYYLGFAKYDENDVEIYDYAAIKYQPDISRAISSQAENLHEQLDQNKKEILLDC
jgi:hypothetical protein